MLQLFMFVVCSLIVYEKESGLREMMKMMGLGSFSYWCVCWLSLRLSRLVGLTH